MASFYIDYQACLISKRPILDQYYQFATLLGRRMQRQGKELANKGYALKQPEFYKGDVGFVSLNYDPILLWVQFVANRNLNKAPDVPRIETAGIPLHLFHDFGHMIPARRIEGEEANWPWYPMNEGANPATK